MAAFEEKVGLGLAFGAWGRSCGSSLIGRSQVALRDVSQLYSLSGMKVLSNVDITPNVIKACERDHERRLALIDGNVHTPLKKAFLNFAGVTDGQSGIFTDFVRGTYQYRLWVLQKSA
jgi:hypothetical protein